MSPHRPSLTYLQSGAASLSYIVTSRVPPQCGEVGPDGTAAAVRCSIRLRETRDTYHHTARNHPYNFARPRVCLCPRETKNNDQIRTLFHTDYCRFTPKQQQRHRTERTKKAVVIELSGKKRSKMIQAEKKKKKKKKNMRRSTTRNPAQTKNPNNRYVSPNRSFTTM
jgi:hypothetical protein